MKRLLALLLAAACTTTLAQDGPGYPCQGCLEDQPAFDQPTSALWYAADRPGTGLSLTIQDGFAVGVYYGFTEEGKPLWYLFTGMLERPEGAPNRLRLTAPLQRLENGPCLGCTWQAPDYLDSPGHATLEFDQANHAVFVMDNDSPTNMLPFVAGVSFSQIFPSYTEYAFPDLDGMWVISHEIPYPDGSMRYDSHIGEITSINVTDERSLWHLTEYTDPLDLYLVLSFECRFNANFPGREDPHSDDAPDCWMNDIVDVPGSDQQVTRLYFPVPYANIGASRISAVHPETGVRLTMYRLEYD